MASLPEKIRPDFPPLQKKINKRPIIYFDNACMTLKPKAVIEAILSYYQEHPGCHGRTNHHFGAETTKRYEETRQKFQKFFHAAHPEEIIFVRNATEGLNLVAHTLPLRENDIVISSDIEHNSNLLPWQKLEREKKIKRIIIPTNPDTSFNLELFEEKLSQLAPQVKLISVLSHSNLTGVEFPIKDITRLAHKYGALVCVDAAQSALSHPINVKDWDADFLVVSVHKMWGPTGVGILYGKKKLLESLPQFITGGETVLDTTFTSATLAGLPDKFEAGLQNYAGVIGAGAAVDYIKRVNQDNIKSQILELNRYATERLLQLPGIRILGPKNPEKRGGILNFIIEGINVMDAARILNQSHNIMLRAGKHCVHSWYNHRQIPDSLRASFSGYNTLEEIDLFIDSLFQVTKYFRR
jgi:cysteine desulfurase/selenocysteine lyase